MFDSEFQKERLSFLSYSMDGPLLEFPNFGRDFCWISVGISELWSGFLDFCWISELWSGFLDFCWDFRISSWISRAHGISMIDIPLDH